MPGKIAETGQLRQDNLDKTAVTEWLEHDNPEQDSRDSSVWTGRPDRSAGSHQPDQDREERMVRT
jgi:hypothetical protein